MGEILLSTQGLKKEGSRDKVTVRTNAVDEEALQANFRKTITAGVRSAGFFSTATTNAQSSAEPTFRHPPALIKAQEEFTTRNNVRKRSIYQTSTVQTIQTQSKAGSQQDLLGQYRT